MAAVSRAGSGRMYSWWWDSHISPKNSKWLQENLTDMDSKVKTMIKLIEEDADSFARRAEMYYKKRPELMKMVEEFYRAYRALAERYDHATGVIRQAQRTMVEAFPNQAPFMLGDDSPAGSATGDPSQQDPSTPIRAFFEPYDLAKDGQGQPFQNPSDAKRNVTLTEESDSAVTRKDLKQTDGTRLKDDARFAEGRVRKGLKFDQPLENEDHSQRLASEKTDYSQEILELKKALAEVKLQKDAGLIQFQESLVKLSVLETEVSRAQENSRVLTEQATQAEYEIQALKKALLKLEAEKEASLQQYQQYLNQLSNMESNNSSLLEETDQLRQRTTKAETEAQSLREEIGKVVAEKDITLNQYMGSLEMISKLEHKLECCQEDARNLKERAEKAENEVETLKLVISKLTEEKEAAVLKYEKCMTTISSLEHELTSAQEEAQRLNNEVDNSFASLKNAEERCIQLEKSNQSLHFEVETLMSKMGSQSQDLTEKQKELGRLWTCIQEERLRFAEAETAFQTLQHLHVQAQNELQSLSSELQNKVESLMNIETHNKSLQDQFMMVNEENKSLNELNTSSSLTIQHLGNEISGLKETKGQLEEEVELRVEQGNALQQELFCLKEELNVLNEQHSSILEQVHAVGLSPERLDSSVKELQDENTSLKETCLREKNEKIALLQKVVILDQLLQKNSMLETSLADLNAELEALREKIEALEESYKSLSEEKSSLVDEKASLTAELKTTNENLQKISEQNAILENSLSGAHGELRGLKTKSSSLEDSLKLLVNQKASERDSLTSELVSTQVRLENLENIYSDLGEKYSALKDEKEASLCKIEELNISLDFEKKEHAKLEELNKLQLFKMENEMKSLLEELERTKGEYEKEFQNAFESQTEINILRRCVKDFEEKNFDLLTMNHNLSETSESLSGLLKGLEQDHLNQEIEMKAVSQQASTLRMGIFKFFKAVHTDSGNDYFDGCEQDHVSSILSKLGETQTFFHRSKEENFLLSTESSVLVTMLQQLKMEAENLAVQNAFESQTEINILRRCVKDFEEKNFDLLAMNKKLSETSESLSGLLKGLEQDHLNQEIEMKAVSQQASTLRMGIFKFFKTLHIDFDHEFFDRCEQDHVSSILSKLGETLTFFHRSKEENFLLSAELSVFVTMLQQLKMDAENIAVEKSVIDQEFRIRGDQLMMLQNENLKLKKTNEEMIAKIIEGGHKEEESRIQMLDLQKTLLDLQRENIQTVEERESLKNGLLLLEEKNRIMEEENCDLCMEVHSVDLLSVLLRSSVDEKSKELKAMNEDLHRLNGDNFAVSQRLNLTERMLDDMLVQKGLELQKLREEQEKAKLHVEASHTEKQILVKEIDMWEKQAMKFFDEMQVSDFYQIVHAQKLLELAEACQRLSSENTSKESCINLLNETVGALEEKIRNMEEENCDLCMGVHSVDLLSVFLRSCVDEKSKELIAMNEDLLRLNGDNFAVSQKLNLTERMLDDTLIQKGLELQQLREEQEKAKLHAEEKQSCINLLNETVGALEEKIRNMEEEMQVSDFNQIVHAQKLLELAEASQRLSSEITCKESCINLLNETVGALEGKIRNMEEENCDLCLEEHSIDLLSVFLRSVVDEKSKELKVMGEDLHRLHGDNFALSQKLNLTERMLNDTLVQKGLELQQLWEEQEKAKLHAEATHFEKQILVKEIDMWEKQAFKSLDEMQVSDLYQIVYAQKLRELAEACQRLASENTSKESRINLLNETVSALTSQSGNLNTQLAAYEPAITALKQSILSLEKCSSLQVNYEKPLSGEPKDAGIENQLHESSACHNEDSMVSDAVSDLHDLQRRIQSIEKAVVEREHLISQESLNVHSELETAMKHIAELKSVSSLSRRQTVSEMSEMENGALTKDIMLDEASESSPYGSSKREHVEVDSQIFESWETADRDCTIDLTTSKGNKAVSPTEKQASFHRTRSLKKQKSNRLASDAMIEKELGVDKLEISKRFVEPPQEGQKKRVLERLNSDIQKLANLQITVEDLRRKLKIIQMSKKGKSMEECEILKEQLEEADANIMKLFDQNAKLMKNVDETPSSTHSKSSMDADESGSVKGRRNSEHARRMSEKIGRIQMEVQKIQFVLLKLDVENDTKGKSKISEARRRVLLKDYLYGGGVRSAYRRKKAAFCSCIRPPTEGD